MPHTPHTPPASHLTNTFCWQIDWLGRSVPLTALSVRVPLSQSRGIQKEMEQVRPRYLRMTPTDAGLPPHSPRLRCRLILLWPPSQAPPTDFDEVMGTYDNLFIQYGEALGAIAAEMEVRP
jgi:hypothetical protein